MEMLGNNHETQMAQSHLFLSLADRSMPMSEARGNLVAIGDSFVEKYGSVLPERQALIYQYGVHPNGSLIDLRDITEQLKREWVAALSVGTDFTARTTERRWTLGFTPSHYQGRVKYSVPVLCSDVVEKIIYAPNGTVQYEGSSKAEEASVALQLLGRVLDQPLVINRAEVLLTANTYYREQLARLALEDPLDRGSKKKHQKDVAEFKKLINIIKFT